MEPEDGTVEDVDEEVGVSAAVEGERERESGSVEVGRVDGADFVVGEAGLVKDAGVGLVNAEVGRDGGVAGGVVGGFHGRAWGGDGKDGLRGARWEWGRGVMPLGWRWRSLGFGCSNGWRYRSGWTRVLSSENRRCR